MTRVWQLAMALCLSACGGASGGLDLHFRASSDAWAGVVAAVASAPPPAAHDAFAFTLTADTPSLLLAHDTTGNERWRSEVEANAQLLVTDDSVITVEGNALVVRDASTGRSRFQRSLEGMSLLGVTQEGDTLVCVTATPSITAVDPTSAVFALHAETGSLLWERRVTAALGAPVLRANVVFVPWNRQGLTAIDAQRGHELARHEPERTSIDWIRQDAAVISYGNDQLFVLGCEQGSDACVPQPSPFAAAPSHPALQPSAYRAPTTSGIATQLRMMRDANGSMRLADDRAYLIFYRYVFAFRSDGTLAWVQLMDRDVVRAQPFDQGIALLDAQGRVTYVRALDGHRTDGFAIGRSVRAAALSGAWSLPSTAAAPGHAPDLHAALRAVILDHDNRLVVARAYAVEQLASDPDPVITKELLAAYEDRATPSGLRQVIARALIERHTGSEHLIDALARHHDFLTGVFPPPLPVVVPALLAMNERRAVPALMEQLQDPATASEDIGLIADALAQLGDVTLAAQLLPWLKRYRASNAFAGDPATVTALAKAARALGGDAITATLLTTADASDTHPVFAAAIREALVIAAAPDAPAENVPAPEAPAPLAKKLSQHDLNVAFAAHTDALRLCTFNELADNPDLRQVRIAFVARPDGSTHGFAFAPASPALAKCLKPIVDAITLPPFDGSPQLATYVVQLHSQATEPVVAPEGTEPVAEWWSWYAREIPSEGAAWWSRYVERELDWLPAAANQEVVAPERSPVPPAATGTRREPAIAPSAPTPSSPATGTPPSPPPAVDSWWLPTQP